MVIIWARAHSSMQDLAAACQAYESIAESQYQNGICCQQHQASSKYPLTCVPVQGIHQMPEEIRQAHERPSRLRGSGHTRMKDYHLL
eukprot:9467625-Karenia_brevis.AAC.1